jgi:HPt (histidine-containing phosphotransfer) domain-containing protein
MRDAQDSSLSPGILDPEQLQMLIEAGGDESSSLLNEIFGLFESESVEKLKELRGYKAAGDYELLGKAAHALSGSSANIGGRELAREAREIENLCKAGQGEEAAARVEKLESTYQETIRALNQFMQRI